MPCITIFGPVHRKIVRRYSLTFYRASCTVADKLQKARRPARVLAGMPPELQMLQKLMFHGAPVLVTGAGAGIGEACCFALAELDARILAVECNKDSLAKLAT